MARGKRTSKGKQKIEIKKIESQEKRQVSFSKRKFGIFSKANELSTMCGAKVAVLMESPAGRSFSFGSPSVEHVTEMFLKGGIGSTVESDAQEAQRLSGVQQMNNNLMEVGSKIEAAKLKKAALMSRITYLSAKNEDVRRMENVEDLNLTELEKLTETLERFKENIKTKMSKDMVTYSGNPSSTTHGIGEASSSVSAGTMTVFPEPELRVDIAGSSRKSTGKEMLVFPESGLGIDNAGSSDGAGKGNPTSTMLDMSGNGIGEAPPTVSAAAMAVFPEPGPRFDNAGSTYGTGKGIEIDLNLSIYEEDEGFDYMEQMNPFFDLNGNEAGPSEPRRFTEGDYKENFAPNEVPK